MFSDTPGNSRPQRAQPADDQIDLHAGARSAIQRLDDLRIHQRIHLGDDAARASGRGELGFALDFLDHLFVQAERRLQQLGQPRSLREAGELQEQLVHVLADLRIAGEQAVVRVTARGARVVVAGAEMAVAAQAVGFAAHDHRHLGVGLEADDAVHDVGAGFLQPVGELDVRFFVEARAQFDDHRDVLARLRGRDQRIDDRRFVAGAVQRLLDGEHARVGGCAAQEIEHRPEAVERVMQQHVLLADHGQQVGRSRDAARQARREDRVLQIRPLHQVVDRREAIEIHGSRDLVEIDLAERELPHQEGIEIRRTVARHLEANRRAITSMRELAFERAAQVVDFFVVDEQVAVAGDAELVAAEHVHAGEQLGYELLDDAGQQDEALAGRRLRAVRRRAAANAAPARWRGRCRGRRHPCPRAAR